MSSLHRPVLLLAVGALALAGCSSTETTGGPSSSPASPVSPASSAAPTASTTPSAAHTDHSSAPTSGGSANSSQDHGAHGQHTPAPQVATTGPKPTQAAAVAGLQKHYREVAEATKIPANSYDAMSTCVVSTTWSKISVQTANAYVAGALTRIKPADGPLVAKTTADCAQRTVKQSASVDY